MVKFIFIFVTLITLCISAFGQMIAEDWMDKGAELFEQGKYDEALQAYNKAIEINPQLVVAWSGKAKALRALGRTTEADAAMAKARELGYEG